VPFPRGSREFFSSVAFPRGIWRPPSPYLNGTAPVGGGAVATGVKVWEREAY
jgi:hypothetical protein